MQIDGEYFLISTIQEMFLVSFAVDPSNFEQTNPDQLFVMGPFDFSNETNLELDKADKCFL